jgi:hypothetical protein
VLPAAFFPAAFFGATFFTAEAVLASGFFAAAVVPFVDFPLEPCLATERAACLAAAFVTGFAGVFLAGVFFAGVFFTVPPFQPMEWVIAVPRRSACHRLAQARRYS